MGGNSLCIMDIFHQFLSCRNWHSIVKGLLNLRRELRKAWGKKLNKIGLNAGYMLVDIHTKYHNIEYPFTSTTSSLLRALKNRKLKWNIEKRKMFIFMREATDAFDMERLSIWDLNNVQYLWGSLQHTSLLIHAFRELNE